MLRNVFVVVIASIFSLTVLAACNDDTDDGVTILEDEPVTPLDDQTRADDDEPTEDQSEEPGEARVNEEEGPDSPGAGEYPGEEGPELISEYIDVTLIDHEIEMEADTAAAGVVGFILTNEGEHEHGISIEPADSAGDEEQIVGTMFIDPGEDEQLELELEAGEYVVFCPVDDHREQGMETTMTVE